ncbi:MAG TPA: hypothetical protein V6C69_19465 [Trichormus sp.]|jgi:hypothetical protein
MSGSTRYAPLVYAACLFLGTSAGALANPSQSVLDPYNYISAPKSSKGHAASSVKLPEADQTSQTYVSNPGSEEDPKPFVSKAPKEPKEPKAHKFGILGKNKEPKSEAVAVKHEATPKANQGKRVASGIADKTKNIGGGIADKTKSIGGGLADKTKGISGGLADKTKGIGGGIAGTTKSIGGGIASASKASGGYFVKGAKAIGGGLKSTGEKMKDGTESVGSKIAHLGKGGAEDSRSARTGKMVSPTKMASAKDAVKNPNKNPMYTGVNQPDKVAANAPHKVAGEKGLLGKLPFFGHKSDPSELKNPDTSELKRLAGNGHEQ